MLIYDLKIWISAETLPQSCITHFAMASTFRYLFDLTGQVAVFFPLVWLFSFPEPSQQLTSESSCPLSILLDYCHGPKKWPDHSVALLSDKTGILLSVLSLLLTNVLPGNLIIELWSRRNLGDHLRPTSSILRWESKRMRSCDLLKVTLVKLDKNPKCLT